jgi:pyrroloquinoline quinone (PQQ) biosynthesis protein C
MNEIILDEESGPHPDGGFVSHFELYLDAMQSAGADTSKIHALLKALEEGKTLEECLDSLPDVVSDYLKQTFRTIQGGDLTELMASFCYGREDIIPDMFRRLITNLSEKNPTRWEKLGFYFTEHIDCDETRHGPMARAMLERHCSNDLKLWEKAEKSAKSALIQRKNFWDGILAKIEGLG